MELQYLHNKLLRFVEKIFSKSNFLTEFYIDIQERTVLEEFSQFDLDINSKVLIMGCGSIPNTVRSLARNKKWEIVSIDRDEIAVRNAEKIIDRYGLKNVIVKKADGMEVDLKGYNLIVVALGIEPKSRVLERISKDADSGTYILCRTAGAFSKIFGKENLEVNGLKMIKRYRRKDGTESIVFVKE